MVLAHTDAGQARRLVGRLAEMGNVYLHVDARVDIRPFAQGVPASVRWVTPRVRVRWGCVSVVWAILSGLRAALRERPAYIHLLSGQDYPLVGAGAVCDYLSAHDGQEFMEVVPRPDERARYQRFHLDQDVRWSMVRRPLERLLNLVGAPRTPPFEVHFGSGWWTITGALAQYLVDFCAARPDVMRYFRHTLVPDEMLFHSIVMQSPFRDAVAGHNLRFIEMDAAHARTLTAGDLPQLRASGRLFARKFRPGRSCDALDALDQAAGRP